MEPTSQGPAWQKPISWELTSQVFTSIRPTCLGASLVAADLSEADLSEADLSDANLMDANLMDADLSSATGVTNERLERQANTLQGATMPNGQKYEDWLKDKKAHG
jgi:uncharacterized protein YjbI with pentapeptide repeats